MKVSEASFLFFLRIKQGSCSYTLDLVFTLKFTGRKVKDHNVAGEIYGSDTLRRFKKKCEKLALLAVVLNEWDMYIFFFKMLLMIFV